MRHLEDGESMALMSWAGVTQFRGKHVADYLIHIPNGGKRDAREAGRLKRMGVRAGVPDYFLHVPKIEKDAATITGGLWIELKAGKYPQLSDSQSHQLIVLAACGYDVSVCRGWQAAAIRISQYLGIPCSLQT